MQFPVELNNLLRQFHRDFFRDTTPDKAITSALTGLSQRQRDTVRRFLDELLSAPYDVEELYRLRWSSGADIAPSNAGEVPVLLEFIRKLIDKQAAR